jgi:hypothetical protein
VFKIQKRLKNETNDIVSVADSIYKSMFRSNRISKTINISNLVWPTSTQNVQKLLYDYEHLRVRFDIQGWRAKQNETYMIKYKPEGAEADSVRRKELVIKQRLTMKLFF